MSESTKSEAETKSESASGTESKNQDTKVDDIEGLGDKGRDAIRRERDARETAEKETKRLKKLVDDAETATKKREADEAAAAGKFEELATARQQEIDRLTADLAERDKTALREKVGRSQKLPDALIVLLQGDDEKALEAHAKELAKHVKPPTAAETEAGVGNRTSNGGLSNVPKEGEQIDVSNLPAYSFRPSRGVPIPQ